MARKDFTRSGKMSQAKVDKYKDQKKNRDKIMKREKRSASLRKSLSAWLWLL